MSQHVTTEDTNICVSYESTNSPRKV